MALGVSSTAPAHARRTTPSIDTAQLRTGLLLVLVFACTCAGLTSSAGASSVPAIWPAAGVAAGVYLTSPRYLRRRMLQVLFLLFVAAHLIAGYPVLLALGFSTSSVSAIWTVRRLLTTGLHGRRVALLDNGDVSRLVASIAIASAVAGVGCGLTDAVARHGDPLLAGLAAFGAHAAAMMVLLPLFLETLHFQPLAGRWERAVRGTLTVGTTVAVFLPTGIPPIVFAIMPMFAWHAFRGSLREATVLLSVVGVIGTGLTMAGIGPIYGLGVRYGLPPEIANGVLQLFLLDCGLTLLPLSVMVTQQRMAAAQADAERETLQRLVASATGTAIIATGPDCLIQLFNPGAEAMLGYRAEELLGERPDTFLGEEELRRHAADLAAQPTFADICRASVEVGDRNRLWRLRRGDDEGAERTVRMSLTAVLDARGQQAGYLATADDVTEREAAQQALLQTLEHQRTAVERLRELERVKRDFVSTVSHELRTPITSIIGYTELLDDGSVGELSAAQLDILVRVGRSGRRLLLLVEDLLTLSQVESAQLKIEPVPTDVRAVVEHAYEALAPALRTRTLEVVLDLPDTEVVQDGDPAQLERMVLNLLTNAVKFTPDGGQVLIRLEPGETAIELMVADTGIGIPEDEQAQLFTRFFRSSTATARAIQGTGLGLTIVQTIVSLHGGRIEISSAADQGTTVQVTLPRVVSTLGAGAAAAVAS